MKKPLSTLKNRSLRSDMEYAEAISSYQALLSLPESQRHQAPRIFSTIANCYLRIARSKTLTELQRMKLAAAVQLLLDFVFPYTQETLPSETKAQLLKTCYELVLSQKPSGVFAFKDYLPLFKKTNEEWFQLASDAFETYFPARNPQNNSKIITTLPQLTQAELDSWDELLKKEERGKNRNTVRADCFLEKAKIYYQELKNHPRNSAHLLEKIYCLIEIFPSFGKELSQNTLLDLLDLLTKLDRLLSLCIKDIKKDQIETKSIILAKVKEFTDKQAYPSFFFLGVVDWLELPASDALLKPLEIERSILIQWNVKFLKLKRLIIKNDLLNNNPISNISIRKILQDLKTSISELEHIQQDLQRIAHTRKSDSVILLLNFNMLDLIKKHQETLTEMRESAMTLSKQPHRYHAHICKQFEQLETLITIIQSLIEQTKCSWVDDYIAYLKASDEYKKRCENVYEKATPKLALEFIQETWDFLQINYYFLNKDTCKNFYHTVLQHHIYFYAHSVPALESKNAVFLFNSVKNATDLESLTKYCTEDYLNYLAKIHRSNQLLYQIKDAPLNCLRDLHRRDLFLAQWTLARALASNFSHAKGDSPEHLNYLLTQISLHYDSLVQLLPLAKQNANTPSVLMLELYTLLNVFYLRYNDTADSIYVTMCKSFLKIAEKHVENYPTLFAPLSDQRALLALIVEKQNEMERKVFNAFKGKFWKLETDQERVTGNVYTQDTSKCIDAHLWS